MMFGLPVANCHSCGQRLQPTDKNMAETHMDDSSQDDSVNENPLTKAKNAGANLQEPEKASIARERKLQCNPPDKKRNIRGTFSDPFLYRYIHQEVHTARSASMCDHLLIMYLSISISALHLKSTMFACKSGSIH